MKALEILQKKLDLLNQELSEVVTHDITTEWILEEIEETESAIEELTTLQSNYEAQEIIIADLKKQKSNLDRLLDQATYSLRCEELIVADLKKQLDKNESLTEMDWQ